MLVFCVLEAKPLRETGNALQKGNTLFVFLLDVPCRVQWTRFNLTNMIDVKCKTACAPSCSSSTSMSSSPNRMTPSSDVPPHSQDASEGSTPQKVHEPKVTLGESPDLSPTRCQPPPKRRSNCSAKACRREPSSARQVHLR